MREDAGPVELVDYSVHVVDQLKLLGEDPQREGLEDTPMRVARAMEYLTRGYGQDPREILAGALFEAPSSGPVSVRDVEFYSLCEHHVLPFYGVVHLSYVPHTQIVGLSKVARLVNVYARRLQVQERLTDQIARAFYEVVEPEAVVVTVEAQHFCMMMRGVQKQQSATVTWTGYGDARVMQAILPGDAC